MIIKPKEKISTLIKKYKETVEEYANDPFISRINIPIIKDIEEHGPKELQDSVEKLRVYLEVENKHIFDENKITLFAAYNEILSIKNLLDKGLDVHKIKEKKGVQTPDFCLKIFKNDFYLELKTQTFADHLENFPKMIESSLDAKADEDRQMKSGEKIIVSEYSINPYNTEYGAYTYEAATLLIDRINNQIKTGQIEFKDKNYSFLIVDLRLLGPICTKEEFLNPNFKQKDERTKQYYELSNQLWITALGKIGEIIKLKKPDNWYPIREPLWEEKTLDKNGILRDYPKLKGLLFQIESLSNTNFTYIGYSIYNDAKTKMAMDAICEDYLIYSLKKECIIFKKSAAE